MMEIATIPGSFDTAPNYKVTAPDVPGDDDFKCYSAAIIL